MTRDRVLRNWFPPLAIVALAVFAWEGYVRLSGTPAWLLPPPSALPEAFLGARAALLRHTLVTLSEVLLGLAASIVVGLACAVAIAWSPVIERAVYPLVVATQAVPLPVLAPLVIIFLGYDLAPKIFLVALICFFPIVVNSVDGLRAVDRELLDLLRTFGATRWQVFTKVRWPAALPFLFSGLRVAAAVSVIGAVFGELVGASAGLGFYINDQSSRFNRTAVVFSATLILAGLGVLLFLLVRAVEWLLLPWRRVEKRGVKDEG